MKILKSPCKELRRTMHSNRASQLKQSHKFGTVAGCAAHWIYIYILESSAALRAALILTRHWMLVIEVRLIIWSLVVHLPSYWIACADKQTPGQDKSCKVIQTILSNFLFISHGARLCRRTKEPPSDFAPIARLLLIVSTTPKYLAVGQLLEILCKLAEWIAGNDSIWQELIHNVGRSLYAWEQLCGG